MNKYYLFFAMLMISFGGFSQKTKTMKNVDQTIELSADVVSFFMKDKYTDAFESLMKYWPMPQNELADLQTQTVKYMNILDARFGEKQAYSKVRNEVIEDFVIRETYLIRYEKSAIRLIFTYYKNDDGWIVNAFKWDDKFSEEFE